MSNKYFRQNIIINIFFIILISFLIAKAKSQTIHDINEDVQGYSIYKKAEFSQDASSLYYFKHEITFESKSKVTAFRFIFDEFNSNFKNSKIFCTSVESSTSDDQLKIILNSLDSTTSSCIGDFTEEEDTGIYDGIIKLSDIKKKIGIILKLNVDINFTARIFLRIAEETLAIKEQEKLVK